MVIPNPELQAGIQGGQRGLRIIAFSLLGLIAIVSFASLIAVGFVVNRFADELAKTRDELTDTQDSLRTAEGERRDLRIVAEALVRQLQAAGIDPEIRIPLTPTTTTTAPPTTTTTVRPRVTGITTAAPPRTTTTTARPGTTTTTGPPTTTTTQRPPVTAPPEACQALKAVLPNVC